MQMMIFKYKPNIYSKPFNTLVDKYGKKLDPNVSYIEMATIDGIVNDPIRIKNPDFLKHVNHVGLTPFNQCVDYKGNKLDPSKGYLITRNGRFFEATLEQDDKEEFVRLRRESDKDYRVKYRDEVITKEKAYREAKKKELLEKPVEEQEAIKVVVAEKKKAYQEANKEKIAERNKAYQEANKEKIAEKQKAYREANKEKIAEKERKYREAKKALRPPKPIFKYYVGAEEIVVKQGATVMKRFRYKKIGVDEGIKKAQMHIDELMKQRNKPVDNQIEQND